MSGFVYKWYNLKNGMYYIGSHRGTIDDGYIGSGIYFKRAFEKSSESFIREILYTGEHFRNYEEMILEYLDAANDSQSYNLKNSAIGQPKGYKHSKETKEKQSRALKGKNKGAIRTKEHREKIRASLKGRKPSIESRMKMSKSQKKPIHCGLFKLDFDSIGECSEYLGLNRSTISSMLYGRLKNKYKLKLI